MQAFGVAVSRQLAHQTRRGDGEVDEVPRILGLLPPREVTDEDPPGALEPLRRAGQAEVVDVVRHVAQAGGVRLVAAIRPDVPGPGLGVAARAQPRFEHVGQEGLRLLEAVVLPVGQGAVAHAAGRLPVLAAAEVVDLVRGVAPGAVGQIAGAGRPPLLEGLLGRVLLAEVAIEEVPVDVVGAHGVAARQVVPAHLLQDVQALVARHGGDEPQRGDDVFVVPSQAVEHLLGEQLRAALVHGVAPDEGRQELGPLAAVGVRRDQRQIRPQRQLLQTRRFRQGRGLRPQLRAPPAVGEGGGA